MMIFVSCCSDVISLRLNIVANADNNCEWRKTDLGLIVMSIPPLRSPNLPSV